VLTAFKYVILMMADFNDVWLFIGVLILVVPSSNYAAL
jgi:hypothetical protein